MLAIPKKIGSLLGQRDTNRLLAGGWLGYVEICDFLPACYAFLSTRVRSWSACCWSSWSSRNWEATLCIMAAATSLDRNSLTAWQCKQACNLPSIGARFTQTSLTRRKRAPAKSGLSGNPRAQTQVKARDLGTESAQARKIWATKTKSQRVNGFKGKPRVGARWHERLKALGFRVLLGVLGF